MTQTMQPGRPVLPAQIGAPASLCVPDWVDRSWQRCLASGRHWSESVEFDPVRPDDLDQALLASSDLIAASQPTMLHLARAVSALRHLVIVTDCRGLVISVGGDTRLNGPVLRAAARIGVDLSEPCVGTTSIGAVLHEQSPLSVRGDEHYFSALRTFNCAAAPLFGVDGRLIGVLDVSSDVVPDGPRLIRMISAASRDIQARLFERLCADAFVIRINWHPGELGSPDDAMIGLGPDGEIVAANDAARELWPRLANAIGQAHMSDMFVNSHGQVRSALEQGARIGEPVRLALAHGMFVWAMMASQPTPFASGRPVALRPRETARRPSLPKRAAVADRFGEYVAHRLQPEAGQTSGEPRLSTIADDLIFRTVEAHGGNVAHAARTLGIGRSTIYRRLRYRLRDGDSGDSGGADRGGPGDCRDPAVGPDPIG